jgi:hypothetical protein
MLVDDSSSLASESRETLLKLSSPAMRGETPITSALLTTSQARKRRLPRSKQIDSIAVLPLVNASSDQQMEYLSDGITESIINSLAQLPGLRVVPRSTVFRYKAAGPILRKLVMPWYTGGTHR